MQCLFKCMKNVSVQICGGGSEFIGNQEVQLEKLQWFEGMQLEKLQWFEGVQLFIIFIHTYIYIYIYIYNSQQPQVVKFSIIIF